MADSSVVSQLSADTWCCTEIRKECSFTFRWTVKNLSTFVHIYKSGEYMESVPFSGKNDDRKWCLRLCPHEYARSDFGDRYTHYQLYLVLISGQAVYATFSVSAVNDKGVKEEQVRYDLPERFVVTEDPKDSRRGKAMRICCNLTSEKRISLFANDCLKLLCEVTILTAPHITSGEGEFNVPKSQDNITNDLRQLLLEDREHCDVILSVDDQELPAHRAILAARSSVFSAMFKNEMKEKNQNRVEITDLHYDTVVQMLRFIYIDEVADLTAVAQPVFAVVAELFRAADKYQLQRLKSLCEDALSSNMNSETATEILILADLHNANDLKRKTMEFVNSNRNDVKKTDAWKRAIESHSKLIIETFF